MKVSNHFLFFLVCCLLFIFVFLSCNPPLDHFKVWQISSDHHTINDTVTLVDQFYRKPRNGEVLVQSYLANPVDKIHNGKKYPIINPNAHLLGYGVAVEGDHEPIIVNIKNQFGRQEFVITEPSTLLVPTEKIEPGSSFPQGLDHYLCYSIEGYDSLNLPVTLEDQFDKRLRRKEEVNILGARWFCVPVDKNGEGIINGVDHLTYYDIDESPINFRVDPVVNQFYKDTSQVTTFKPIGLFVPTKKLSWRWALK